MMQAIIKKMKMVVERSSIPIFWKNSWCEFCNSACMTIEKSLRKGNGFVLILKMEMVGEPVCCKIRLFAVIVIWQWACSPFSCKMFLYMELRVSIDRGIFSVSNDSCI